MKFRSIYFRLLAKIKETVVQATKVAPVLTGMWLKAAFVYTPLLIILITAIKSDLIISNMMEIFSSIAKSEYQGSVSYIDMANMIFIINFSLWFARGGGQRLDCD